MDFRNRRSETSLRLLTMPSSQRTTTTPQIATSKKMEILRVPLPWTVSRNLTDEEFSMANTENAPRRE